MVDEAYWLVEAAAGVIVLPAVNLRLFLTSHYQP